MSDEKDDKDDGYDEKVTSHKNNFHFYNFKSLISLDKICQCYSTSISHQKNNQKITQIS